MALQDLAKRVDMFMVPVGMIEVDPEFNPRVMTAPDTVAWIDELAAAIGVRGFDEDRPLLGRYAHEKFIVTDGHCRLAAVKRLIASGREIIAIPCAAARTPEPRLDPAQKGILGLLTVWDSFRTKPVVPETLLAKIEGLRELVP